MRETPEWADWRQLLETGRHFTAVTRAEAQQRAQELVREGKLAQDKVQAFADGLVRASRKRADELVDVVRAEVRRQLEAVGLKDRPSPAKKKAAKKKGAKEQAAKKKTAKKKTAKEQAGKKKTAKKKTAKKKTAKKQSGAEQRLGST